MWPNLLLQSELLEKTLVYSNLSKLAHYNIPYDKTTQNARKSTS